MAAGINASHVILDIECCRKRCQGLRCVGSEQFVAGGVKSADCHRLHSPSSTFTQQINDLIFVRPIRFRCRPRVLLLRPGADGAELSVEDAFATGEVAAIGRPIQWRFHRIVCSLNRPISGEQTRKASRVVDASNRQPLPIGAPPQPLVVASFGPQRLQRPLLPFPVSQSPIGEGQRQLVVGGAERGGS